MSEDMVELNILLDRDVENVVARTRLWMGVILKLNSNNSNLDKVG